MNRRYFLFCVGIFFFCYIEESNSGSWTKAELSQSRSNLAATTVDYIALFGGGYNSSYESSDQVDIYNATSNQWTTSKLYQARYNLAATSVNDIALFGGGLNNLEKESAIVDIYNVTSKEWITGKLSHPRASLAATSVNDIALFGGGYNSSYESSSVVDIYNATSNQWITGQLSHPRACLAATSVNDIALFGGGYNISYESSSRVDIYNVTLNEWKTASLSQGRAYLAATSVNDIALFGGGLNNSYESSSRVDIYNVNLNEWKTARLSEGRYSLSATSLNNIALFAGGINNLYEMVSVVDIYNSTTDIWTTSNLFQKSAYLASTSVSNILLFGGGESESLDFIALINIYNPEITPTNSTSNIISEQIIKEEVSISSLVIGILAGLLGLILIIIIIIIIIKFRFKRKDDQEKEIIELRKNQIDSGSFYNSISVDLQHLVKESEINETNYGAFKTKPVSESQNYNLSSPIPTKNLDYTELIIEKKIGSGAFGEVYLGSWRGTKVAVKKIKNIFDEILDQFEREAEIMQSLPSHSNIIQFIGISLDEKRNLCILTQYCPNGSVYNLLKSNKIISDEMIFKIIKGTVAGMLHLHSENIIHRDLAARNLLLDQLYETKISDFGLSRLFESGSNESKTNSEIGPLKHMAPECMLERKYSIKSDVWAFGVTLYEIYTRGDPYPDHSSIEAATLVCQRIDPLRLPVPSNMNKIMSQIFKSCFETNPQDRPSFKIILNQLSQIEEN